MNYAVEPAMDASGTISATKCSSPFLTIRFLRIFLLVSFCVPIFLYLNTYRSSVWTQKLTNALSGGTVALNDLELTFTSLQLTCPHNAEAMAGLCQTWRPRHPSNDTAGRTDHLGQPRCVMSIIKDGRLGNTMGQYATLLALARMNRRPAFMLPAMAKTLRTYFQVTMPSLSAEAESCLEKNWTRQVINDWMTDDYRSFKHDPEQPLMLSGYPCSWTFFDHIRQEIRREFRLQPHLEERAQVTLRALLDRRNSVTYVGVHVRRSDYVRLMTESNRGVVADAGFFKKAMEYFRSRYSDAVFMVASDDMDWCRNNMNNSLGDVFFAGQGNISDPIGDFAMLSLCNHSIITIGTYGFWTAYLAGGEVVYLTNFTLPDSQFLNFFHYDAAFLPSWRPIAANLSGLLTNVTDTKRVIKSP